MNTNERMNQQICITVTSSRTCSDVKRLLVAVNNVILRIRVKQLLGNDAKRLLSKLSVLIPVRLHVAAGSWVNGVLVMVSSCSSETQRDSRRVMCWVSRDVVDWLNCVPLQSTVNLVQTSCPLRGKHMHPAGQSDFRTRTTSSVVVHLTSSEYEFFSPRVAGTCVTGSKFLCPLVGPFADRLTLSMFALMT